MKTPSIDEVMTKLTSIPKSLKEATGASGLPREPGLYASWTVPGSIPDVPRGPHPTVVQTEERELECAGTRGQTAPIRLILEFPGYPPNPGIRGRVRHA